MASPVFNTFMKVATRINITLYRLSKGKFANRIGTLPILLITTTGKKSGKQRTTPVVFIQDGEDYTIAGSVGGMGWNPAWYHNLKSNPQAQIEVGDKTMNVKAIFTEGEERTRLYEQFKAAGENFVQYEQRTDRVIPVIRLRPM